MEDSLFISNSNTMNEIKRFIIASCIVVVGVVAVDVTMGVICDKLTRKLPLVQDKIAKSNYVLNDMERDIVIFGSSRGNKHYVTSQLYDSIRHYTGYNYSVYNASLDGQGVNCNACLAEAVLKRYTPKLVIFEITEWELLADGSDLEFVAPHYKHNNVAHEYLNMLGWKERLKMLSGMYRYNSKLPRMLLAGTQPADSTGYTAIEGLQQVVDNPESMRPIPEAIGDGYNPLCIQNFKRIIVLCQKKNVPLLAVTSPEYKPYDNNTYIQEICQQYNVPYLNRYNMELFNNNPQWFWDGYHLNDEGAHIYTSLFFQDLKNYLTPLIQQNSNHNTI